MASSFLKIPLLCLIFLFSAIISPSLSASNEFPNKGYIRLPVKKDGATQEYYTSIGIGTPTHHTNLVIDLSGTFLWYDCYDDYHSSSYRPVNSNNTEKCPTTGSGHSCNSDDPKKPGCTQDTCIVFVENPFAKFQTTSGDLGEDLLFLPQVKVPRHFVSGCTNSDSQLFVGSQPLFFGTPNGTKGFLGLAGTKYSLPNQISSLYNVIPKFTLCLPSSSSPYSRKSIGGILIGGWILSSSSVVSVSQIGFKSSSKEYFIGVGSINIDDKPVKFNTSLLSIDKNGNGGTKISTTSPYTVLHSSIYNPFVTAFVKATSDRKITRVKSVKPFGACFDAKTINQDLPTVNLVVEGRFGKENFDFVGHNAVVEVKRGVLCLAFVDGGKNATTAIVIGGHQLEERVLEFDLSTSILSFSSSLLLHNATCSSAPFL